MNNKSKVFVVLSVVLSSVVLLTCTCFAEVSSHFVEDTTYGYKWVASSPDLQNSINISSCPSSFGYGLFSPQNATINLSLTITNDTDKTYTMTFWFLRDFDETTPAQKYSINNGADSTLPSGYANNHTTATVTLSPGDVFKFTMVGAFGSVKYDTANLIVDSISPDPQYTPSPVEVLLDSVSEFLSSFFSQASDIVSMIVSSWVFLVPITMMLVVFFVMAIRKIVKGI